MWSSRGFGQFSTVFGDRRRNPLVGPWPEKRGTIPSVRAGGIERTDPRPPGHVFAETAPADGTPGWEDIGDAYRLLGELSVLVDRLPQVCDQLARHFQRPALQTGTRSDSATSETPSSLLGSAAAEMIRADEHGRAMGRCIAAAHAAVSHLAPVRDGATGDAAIADGSAVGEGWAS